MKNKLFVLLGFLFFSSIIFSQEFIKGVDLSSLQELENSQVKFYSSDNNQIIDVISFFSEKKIDCVRFRLWVNPELSEKNPKKSSYCNLENTILMAKRVKDAGMKVLIDFHYSDYWADPANQTLPKKWEEKISNLNYQKAIKELENIIFDYTLQSLQEFKNSGVEVDFVQIGNEITNGLLWPYGTIKDNGSGIQKFSSISSLLKQGISATKNIFPNANIILHIDSSGDLSRCLWWFSCAEKSKLDYDIIGLSYYSLWHGSDLSKLENCVKTLSDKFNKSVFIVETAYPWTLGWNDNLSNLYGIKNQLITGFEATPEGQKLYFDQLCALMKRAVKNYSSAVFWWEPTWISEESLGVSSTIENTTWFDFQNRYIGPL